MTYDPEREFPGFGPWTGIVIRRDDPEGLYRVKLKIPGRLDETDWAYPFGFVAGNKRGGGPFVPELGTKALVFWEGGEINGTVSCIPGMFHRGQVPSGHTIGTGANEGQDNFVWQNAVMRIEVDTRDSSAGLRIAKLDSTGDAAGTALAVDFDVATQQAEISTTLGLVLKSTGAVEIEGGTVTINSRPVSPGGEPI
jgi:hypothetical protein